MRDRPPFWVSASASVIRRLPAGRYLLADALARFAGEPFLTYLPADLGGWSFVCDLRDTIAREACFTGRYEPQETQIAQRILAPGMVVVDVGANWGYFTLVVAHLVGGSGAVIAIEPHPRLAARLADNVGNNGLAHVEIVRAAAAAGAGTASRPFVGFDERGGNWGVSRAARAAEIPEFEARTVALDGLLDQRKVGRVDLVKIDIEGGETEAIVGMSAGLGRRRYRYVLLECHPVELAKMSVSLEECLRPLRQSGYHGWQIDHSAEMHRRAARRPVSTAELVAPIDEHVLESDRWPHFLWVAPGEALPV
jgi:FkbM family methyltransferase